MMLAHFIGTCSHWPRNLERCAGLPILTDVDNGGGGAKSWSFPECRDQPAPSTGEPRHHGAYRHFSRLSDLAVVKALDVTQHQRLAEWRRQRRDGGAQMLGIGFSYEFCLRRVLTPHIDDAYRLAYWLTGRIGGLSDPIGLVPAASAHNSFGLLRNSRANSSKSLAATSETAQ
jgi:hypothetical protein